MVFVLQTRNSLVWYWIVYNISINYNTFNNIMKNKTLTKNMPYVKWNAIPPVKGPDSQGVKYGSNKKNPSTSKKRLGKNTRVL